MRLALLALLMAGAHAAPADVLTANGLGRLRVGMPEAQAVRRFHLRVEQADDEDCHVLFSADEHLMVMTRRGRVASVSVLDSDRVSTDRGLHVGSTEAEVRRAYGPNLVVEPNVYADPPALYLTWWARKDVRGIMYETDAQGRVTDIHAGDETIGWTDGCG